MTLVQNYTTYLCQVVESSLQQVWRTLEQSLPLSVEARNKRTEEVRKDHVPDLQYRIITFMPIDFT